MKDKVGTKNTNINEIITKRRYYSSSNALYAGAIAACVSRTLTNPFERVKILKQLEVREYQTKSVTKSLIHIAKSEGMPGMFKGNLTNLIKSAPFAGFEFYFYDRLKVITENMSIIPKNQFTSQVLLGSVSGIAAAFIVYPLEVIRTLLSIDTTSKSVLRPQGSIINLSKQIYMSSGVKGFYRGCIINSYGIAPFIGIKLALYDSLKRTNLICNFLNGAIATFISGIATYPFDYVKRVWQIRDINDVANKKRLPSFVCSVLAKEGVKGLYKGLMACCCKVVPANALLFYFNEKLKALL